MRLTVREVARMFGVPERSVERWIRDDEMPHERLHGVYRFHREELLEWANHRGIRIASEMPPTMRSGAPRPGLSDALALGGVHYDVPATDRESMLRGITERLPIADEVDRDMVFEVLLAREKSGSTGIGDGIAIPHVRSPVVLGVDRAALALCFLDRPIDLAAIDGKPVHTVFALVTPTIRVHLFLLARLSACLHDEGFRRAIAERAPAETILAEARRAEAQFAAGIEEDEADEPDPAAGEVIE